MKDKVYIIPCKSEKCISYPLCYNRTHINCEFIEEFMLESLDENDQVDDLDFCRRFAILRSVLPFVQTQSINFKDSNDKVYDIKRAHLVIYYHQVLLTHNIKDTVVNKDNTVRIIYARKSKIKE